MIVLFFGDIVGTAASEHIADRLRGLRERHSVDLVIANAENCGPDGLGMAAKEIDGLLSAGVDLITGGNHSWDSEESIELLDRPEVLRPYNLTTGVAGHGLVHVDVGGETVTVINLADACAMHGMRESFRPAYASYRDADKRGVVIVDYHGDHVLEKQIFAHAVAGEAAAVLGTHTHEATTPLHLLTGGTAFVTEVGMCGPEGGVQGFDPGNLVTGLRTTGNPFSLPIPPVVEGPFAVGAVLIEIREGAAVSVERIP